jgi:hypothetical protein
MPRETTVVVSGLKARRVTFEEPEDQQDDSEDIKADFQRTAEEIEWARFQQRWAMWKRDFDFRTPDPSNLRCEVWG